MSAALEPNNLLTIEKRWSSSEHRARHTHAVYIEDGQIPTKYVSIHVSNTNTIATVAYNGEYKVDIKMVVSSDIILKFSGAK